MKIKVTEKPYSEVIALTPKKHKRPLRPNIFWRVLLKLVSLPDLIATGFSVKRIGTEKLKRKEPCLFLMNHSSFIDLEIVVSILFPRPFNIIATTDSFIGKNWLMRQIGCIPTKKFTTDLTLVRDMLYTVKTLRSSLVLFPEASYSFDGKATPIPATVAACVKKLGIPVIMIRTYGAFARDPLYNNLQRRKVKVSATEEYILSPEDIEKLTVEEIAEKLNECFSFDNFSWQKENKIKISEPFRADFLNRVLYKCPNCNEEGKTEGKGDTLVCHACKKEWLLTEYGEMQAKNAETEISHIPAWYEWERECVQKEIERKEYRVEFPVDICMTVDTYHLYRVGEGYLVHDENGFHLTGCDGALDYVQKPRSSYSLYSDYNWYEIGDMVCIGNSKVLYYCFPKTHSDIVAKMRLAAEQMYKLYGELENKKTVSEANQGAAANK